MRKTKILAGLLSFAMLASIIPTAMAGKTTTIPTKDGYVFYEDFEGTDYYTKFAVNNAQERWTNKVIVDELDENNHVMDYASNNDYIDSSKNFIKKNTVLMSLTEDKTWEVGYTIDLYSLGSVGLDEFSISLGQGGGPVFKRSKTTQRTTFSVGDSGEIKFQTTVPVQVKIFGRPEAGAKDVYITYQDMDGITHTNEYYQCESTSSNEVVINAIEVAVGETAKGHIYIDNVYIREPDTSSEPSIIFKDGDTTLETRKTTLGRINIADVTPTKEGYTLIGWADEADAEEPDYATDESFSGIEEDKTLYAVWYDETYVTFKVDEDVAKEGYTTLGKITLPTDPQKDNMAFHGWFVGDEKVTADTLFSGESVEATAKFTPIYTVYFYTDDTFETLHKTVKGGLGNINVPVAIADISKGYFAGWYYKKANGAEAVFDPNDFEDGVMVYAKWSGLLYYEDFDDPSGYDHTWDSPTVDDQRWTNEITSDGAMTYTVDADQVLSSTNKYPFGKKDFAQSLPIDVNSTYEFTYKIDLWPDKEKFTQDNGGHELTSSTAAMGIQVQAGSKSYTIGGLTLSDGWHWCTTVSVGGVFLHSDTTKDANGNYISSGANRSGVIDGYLDVRVRFNLSEGEYEAVTKYKTTSGANMVQTDTIAIKDVPADAQTAYITALAQYTDTCAYTPDGGGFKIDDICIKKLENYTVKFDYNYDGAPEPMVKTTDVDGNVVVPTREETLREDYEFVSWWADPECTIPFETTGITGTTTAYASWEKVHKVYFHYYEGKTDEVVRTKTENPLTIPVPEIRKGYQFMGWFTDNETFQNRITDDEIIVTEDMHLYGQWLEGYTVTFDANGGTSPAEDYVVDYPIYIPVPEYEGYRFDGWFVKETDGNGGYVYTTPFDTNYHVTEDIEVRAEWTKKYKVTFDIGIGEWETEPETLYTLEKVDTSTLQIPLVSDGEFEYWTTADGNKWDGTVTEDMTVYAKYDNVIFYEDFENTDGLDYLKILAPTMWETFLAGGAGIVDEKGNKVFRLSAEKNLDYYVDLDTSGSGLYEVSCKFKWTALVKSNSYYIATPAHKNENGTYTKYAGVCFAAGQRIDVNYNGGNKYNTIFSAEDCPQGYVEVVSLYDTENLTKRVILSYTTVTGKSVTNDSGYLPCSNVGTVDAIALFSVNGASTLITDAYVDDICVKKITKPRAVEITPSSGAENVSVGTKVQAVFDQRMDTGSLTETSFYVVDADGNKPEQTISYETDSMDRTVATISFKQSLENSQEYTIRLTNDITNGSYQLDKNYSVKFTTEPEKFNVEYTLVDVESGKTIDKIANYKGKAVKATINLENYKGNSPQSYFASIAFVNALTGKQIAYNCSSATLALGEKADIVTLNFVLPDDVDENYKLKYFIWDNFTEKNILINATVRP